MSLWYELDEADRRDLLKFFAQIKGHTLVALRLYWKDHHIKVELGLGRGKEKADVRADLKEKTEKREAQREVSRFNQRHG